MLSVRLPDEEMFHQRGKDISLSGTVLQIFRMLCQSCLTETGTSENIKDPHSSCLDPCLGSRLRRRQERRRQGTKKSPDYQHSDPGKGSVLLMNAMQIESTLCLPSYPSASLDGVIHIVVHSLYALTKFLLYSAMVLSSIWLMTFHLPTP